MIKVIHLLNHLEKIDRDLHEIEEMKNQLQLDRTYTSRVQDSLESETLRLAELESTISKLVVKEPPAHLASDLENFLNGDNSTRVKPVIPHIKTNVIHRKPAHADIILPATPVTSTNKKSKTAAKSEMPVNTQTQKRKGLPKNETPFRWKFVQK